MTEKKYKLRWLKTEGSGGKWLSSLREIIPYLAPEDLQRAARQNSVTKSFTYKLGFPNKEKEKEEHVAILFRKVTNALADLDLLIWGPSKICHLPRLEKLNVPLVSLFDLVLLLKSLGARFVDARRKVPTSSVKLEIPNLDGYFIATEPNKTKITRSGFVKVITDFIEKDARYEKNFKFQELINNLGIEENTLNNKDKATKLQIILQAAQKTSIFNYDKFLKENECFIQSLKRPRSKSHSEQQLFETVYFADEKFLEEIPEINFNELFAFAKLRKSVWQAIINQAGKELETKEQLPTQDSTRQKTQKTLKVLDINEWAGNSKGNAFSNFLTVARDYARDINKRKLSSEIIPCFERLDQNSKKILDQCLQNFQKTMEVLQIESPAELRVLFTGNLKSWLNKSQKLAVETLDQYNKICARLKNTDLELRQNLKELVDELKQPKTLLEKNTLLLTLKGQINRYLNEEKSEEQRQILKEQRQILKEIRDELEDLSAIPQLPKSQSYYNLIKMQLSINPVIDFLNVIKNDPERLWKESNHKLAVSIVRFFETFAKKLVENKHFFSLVNNNFAESENSGIKDASRTWNFKILENTDEFRDKIKSLLAQFSPFILVEEGKKDEKNEEKSDQSRKRLIIRVGELNFNKILDGFFNSEFGISCSSPNIKGRIKPNSISVNEDRDFAVILKSITKWVCSSIIALFEDITKIQFDINDVDPTTDKNFPKNLKMAVYRWQIARIFWDLFKSIWNTLSPNEDQVLIDKYERYRVLKIENEKFLDFCQSCLELAKPRRVLEQVSYQPAQKISLLSSDACDDSTEQDDHGDTKEQDDGNQHTDPNVKKVDLAIPGLGSFVNQNKNNATKEKVLKIKACLKRSNKYDGYMEQVCSGAADEQGPKLIARVWSLVHPTTENGTYKTKVTLLKSPNPQKAKKKDNVCSSNLYLSVPKTIRLTPKELKKSMDIQGTGNQPKTGLFIGIDIGFKCVAVVAFLANYIQLKCENGIYTLAGDPKLTFIDCAILANPHHLCLADKAKELRTKIKYGVSNFGDKMKRIRESAVRDYVCKIVTFTHSAIEQAGRQFNGNQFNGNLHIFFEDSIDGLETGNKEIMTIYKSLKRIFYPKLKTHWD
ncbi:MAG: hypothetical protein NZT61_07555, partial [Deltaproteobacteria bacterium]|nr:hypothetical protein [Deltaproteobacteria bacterium]